MHLRYQVSDLHTSEVAATKAEKVGAPEIEITPEMIEAAVDELRLHFDSYDLKGTVEALLVAMGVVYGPQGYRLRTKTDSELRPVEAAD